MNKYILEIEDIDKVSKARVEIDNLSVIVGDNNTGKSTICKVLYAYAKTFCGINNDMSVSLLVDKFAEQLGTSDTGDLNVPNEEIIKLAEKNFSRNLGNVFFNQPIVPKGKEFGSIKVYSNDCMLFSATVDKSNKVSIVDKSTDVDKQLPIRDVTYITSMDLLAIRELWLEFKNSKTIQRYIINHISKFANAVSQSDFSTEGIIDGVGSLYFNNTYDVKYKDSAGLLHNINTIGSGYIRLATLLATVTYLNREGELILIEEPESGLYQGHIKELYEFLKNCKARILVVSYSPIIVNMSVTDDSCYYARCDNDVVVIDKPKDYGTMLEEYNKPFTDILCSGTFK